MVKPASKDIKLKFIKKYLSNRVFTQFLEKYGSLKKFKHNIKTTKYIYPDDLDNNDIRNFINDAFYWRNTKEGFDYWDKLNRMCESSIKKTCKLRKK